MPELLTQRQPGLSSRTDSDALTVAVYREGRLVDEEADFCSEREVRAGLTVTVCTYKRPQSMLRFLDSLALQTGEVDQLIVIDASPDAETEKAVFREKVPVGWGREFVYCRVGGQLRGLTRQRNLAIKICKFNQLAFFDDDMVLAPDCLFEMQKVLKEHRDVVGVSASWEEATRFEIGWKWGVLRLLYAIPHLEPGRYTRSGISTPLRLAPDHQKLIEVDRLPGGCTLWRTEVPKRLQFNTIFTGYCQSEDLEFSLRAAKLGRLLVAKEAEVQHLCEISGRPDHVELGRSAVVNRYHIHSTLLENRTWLDALWFVYAQTIYELLMLLGYLSRARFKTAGRYFLGLLKGVKEVLTMRPSSAELSTGDGTVPRSTQ